MALPPPIPAAKRPFVPRAPPPFAPSTTDKVLIGAVWVLILGSLVAVVVLSWRRANAPPPPLAPLPPKPRAGGATTAPPAEPDAPPAPTPSPETSNMIAAAGSSAGSGAGAGAGTSTGTATGTSTEVAGLDPLDAAGEYPNQFTGRANACDWQATSAQWSSLPMYSLKPQLARVIASMRTNSVTIIVSGTGSGKTVITPKLAHRLLADTLPPIGLAERAKLWLRGKRPPGAAVAVTNPKTLTTRENAIYSAKLACVRLGQEIGYRHRDSPASAVSLATRLEYVTDGYLLSVAKQDPDFTEYGTIIVDEAHERPMPTDFLLLALKRAMIKRPELRVVVMSATIDTAPFVEWFRRDGLTVGDISVSGKPNFPVKKTFVTMKKGETYLTKSIETVLQLNRSPDSVPGGVLIFVPVTADTAAGCQLLMDECRKAGLRCSRDPTGGDAPTLRCLRLYSGVDDAQKDVAINPSGTTATRHVVFSTNVAESSLTVEDLSYVIDSGQVFRRSYDAANDATVSGKQSVTKAEATQRMGRVGRRRPGVAILLYPERAFESFADWPKPSILANDVTAQLFEEMASAGRTWAETKDEANRLLTPPTAAQVSMSEAVLRFYGFVGSDAAGALTAAGESFYGLYKAARAELSDCLLLFAAHLTGAEQAAARYVACTESGALTWMSAALKRRGEMPEECGSSDHSTAVRVFEAAARAMPAETALLRQRAEELNEAAVNADLSPEVSRTWPWSWLKQQQGVGVVLGCAFSNNSTRCSNEGTAISLQRCDEFFRAVAAAGIMRANRGGKRLFGDSRVPAVGSKTTNALQSAVNAGAGYSATKAEHVLNLSTAFTEASLSGLLAARR